MQSDWRFVILCAGAACAVVLLACATLTPASALMTDEAKEMRRAVLKRVPVGSAAASAEAVMTAEGFVCTPMHDQPFSTSEPDSERRIAHAATDFLWCDSGKRGLVVTKRWQAMFVDRGGTVSSVAVSVDLGGP